MPKIIINEALHADLEIWNGIERAKISKYERAKITWINSNKTEIEQKSLRR